MRMKTPLGRYRHYKGGLYDVFAVGVDTETLSEVVIYRSLQATGEFPSGTVWVRSAMMFNETVEYQGQKMQRFRLTTPAPE